MSKSNKIENKILEYIAKSFVAFCIFVAFLGVLDFPHNIGNYAWQFMLFAFVAGNFILAIRSEYIKNTKNLSRISFYMILSGILFLVGYGLSFAGVVEGIRGMIASILSVAILFISILVLSIALTFLFFELGKNVFSKE